MISLLHPCSEEPSTAGQGVLSLSLTASSQPRRARGVGRGQPGLPLSHPTQVTPLPPFGSSGTTSELQAESRGATHSGEHRNKVLSPETPPVWGRHGRSSKGEGGLQMGGWVDGWMDGWVGGCVCGWMDTCPGHSFLKSSLQTLLFLIFSASFHLLSVSNSFMSQLNEEETAAVSGTWGYLQAEDVFSTYFSCAFACHLQSNREQDWLGAHDHCTVIEKV